jgi:hypothetical protein
MSPDMLPFSLCNKKRLAIWHMNRPLFPMTLSSLSYDIRKYVRLRTYQHPVIYTRHSSTLEPHQLQRDHPTICIIAQKYSSATLVSFHPHKEKFRVFLNNANISVLKIVL